MTHSVKRINVKEKWTYYYNQKIADNGNEMFMTQMCTDILRR